MTVTQFSDHVSRKTVNHDTAFVQVQHRRDEDAGKHPILYTLGWEFTSADISAGATGGGHGYTTGSNLKMDPLPTNCRVLDGCLNVKTAFRKSGDTGQGMLHAIFLDAAPLMLETTSALTGARWNNLRRGMRSFLGAATGVYDTPAITLESGATGHTIAAYNGSRFSWGVPGFYTGGQQVKLYFEVDGGCTYSTGAAEVMLTVVSYAED